MAAVADAALLEAAGRLVRMTRSGRTAGADVATVGGETGGAGSGGMPTALVEALGAEGTRAVWAATVPVVVGVVEEV